MNASVRPHFTETELAAEMWRPVEDHDGYEVSDLGRVRSFHRPGQVHLASTPRLLRGKPNGYKNRYWFYQVQSPLRTRTGHSLVATAFIGPRPEGMEVCHGDNNGYNNRLSNLRYDTKSANSGDRWVHGTMSTGVDGVEVKLSAERVVHLRELAQAGATYNDLALKFNVHPSVVGRVCRGDIWQYVGGPRTRAGRGRLHPMKVLAVSGLALASLTVAAPAEAATNDLLVIGDSWTQGVGDRDSSNGLGWSPVTASLLGARLTQDGKGGSGYVNRTTYGDNTFGQRVYRHPADAYKWVVLQGSTNDKAYLSSLAANANMTLKAAKKRYPHAVVVVVGPTAINGSPDLATVRVNDKLRAAAWAADVPFIDAIGEGWFVKGDWSRYSDAATGHPNDAGYRMIGQHVAADLANL